jgi:crossover junction endodeoxyribonuclease RuvC
MTKPSYILGIDPGYARVGFACIDYNDHSLVDYGMIETTNDLSFSERLHIIMQDIQELIRKYPPAYCAVEQVFFSVNTTTALKVAHARGVIIALMQEAQSHIIEPHPLDLKSHVCGYGKASKEQMQQMIMMLFHLDEIPKPDDVADAIALAYYAQDHI